MELGTENGLDWVDKANTTERAKIAELSQPVADASVCVLDLAVVLGAAEGCKYGDLAFILIDRTCLWVTRVFGEVIRSSDAASLVGAHVDVELMLATLSFTDVIKVDEKSVVRLINVGDDDTMGQTTLGDLSQVSQAV